MSEIIKKQILDLLGMNKLGECNKLLNAIKPNMLYKYRNGIIKNDSTNEFLDVEALNKGQIWVSSAAELDDPYDCAVLIKENAVKIVEDLRKTMSKFKDEKYISAIESINNDMREQSMICSLSEINYDIDMWARYANCGRGFCIGYSFDELSSYQSLLFPVVYGDITKDISDFGNKQKAYFNTLLKKTDTLNWKNQKEWRIIKNNNHEYKYGELVDVPKPKAIYCKFRFN